MIFKKFILICRPGPSNSGNFLGVLEGPYDLPNSSSAGKKHINKLRACCGRNGYIFSAPHNFGPSFHKLGLH